MKYEMVTKWAPARELIDVIDNGNRVKLFYHTWCERLAKKLGPDAEVRVRNIWKEENTAVFRKKVVDKDIRLN